MEQKALRWRTVLALLVGLVITAAPVLPASAFVTGTEPAFVQGSEETGLLQGAKLFKRKMPFHGAYVVGYRADLDGGGQRVSPGARDQWIGSDERWVTLIFEINAPFRGWEADAITLRGSKGESYYYAHVLAYRRSWADGKPSKGGEVYNFYGNTSELAALSGYPGYFGMFFKVPRTASRVVLALGDSKEELLLQESATENPIMPNSVGSREIPGMSEIAAKRLPPFREQLSGPNEVRVRNPNDFAVSVGLRSGNRGKDFDVPANGAASVYVPDGGCDIYFVYSSQPDALYQGDSFSLNGNGVEIQIVKVIGGNYGIRRVK